LPGIAGASALSGTEKHPDHAGEQSARSGIRPGRVQCGGTDYKKTNRTDLFVFSDGAFTVITDYLEPSPTFNPTTCMVTATEPVRSLSTAGSGRSRESQVGTFSASFMAAYPRKPNGACDLERNAQPTASVSQISASEPSRSADLRTQRGRSESGRGVDGPGVRRGPVALLLDALKKRPTDP